jgi:hypothetical protein
LKVYDENSRIRIQDPDPDPDPFVRGNGSADPDPHQNVMDPEHWVESIPGNENAGKDEIVEVVERPSSDNDVKGNIFSQKLTFMQTFCTS